MNLAAALETLGELRAPLVANIAPLSTWTATNLPGDGGSMCALVRGYRRDSCGAFHAKNSLTSLPGCQVERVTRPQSTDIRA
jgi:hypothetical protein